MKNFIIFSLLIILSSAAWNTPNLTCYQYDEYTPEAGSFMGEIKDPWQLLELIDDYQREPKQLNILDGYQYFYYFNTEKGKCDTWQCPEGCIDCKFEVNVKYKDYCGACNITEERYLQCSIQQDDSPEAQSKDVIYSCPKMGDQNILLNNWKVTPFAVGPLFGQISDLEWDEYYEINSYGSYMQFVDKYSYFHYYAIDNYGGYFSPRTLNNSFLDICIDTSSQDIVIGSCEDDRYLEDNQCKDEVIPNCYIPNKDGTECLVCYNDQWVQSDGTCLTCEADTAGDGLHCDLCDSETTCAICHYGYFLSDDKTECTKCDDYKWTFDSVDHLYETHCSGTKDNFLFCLYGRLQFNDICAPFVNHCKVYGSDGACQECFKNDFEEDYPADHWLVVNGFGEVFYKLDDKQNYCAYCYPGDDFQKLGNNYIYGYGSGTIFHNDTTLEASSDYTKDEDNCVMWSTQGCVCLVCEYMYQPDDTFNICTYVADPTAASFSKTSECSNYPEKLAEPTVNYKCRELPGLDENYSTVLTLQILILIVAILLMF